LFKKSKKIISFAKVFIKARLLKIKIPLIVSWAITYRCNYACQYCALKQRKTDELTTEQIFKLVDILADEGTLMISFTGGEPFLRDDIGRIVDYVHKKGIETKINSNGALVKDKIKELKGLDILHLSLEGPQDIHDAIRQKGSYRQVMEAAEAAKENGIKVNFVTVLTRINLGCLDFILDKAKEIGGKVIFQPATQLILDSQTPNPLVPPEKEYRYAIQKLIEQKKKGNKCISNSITVLRHLYHWPHPKRIRCATGWIACRIEPNADMFYCDRQKQLFRPLNCMRDGFKRAFANLKPIVCNECWCAARVELNYAFYCDIPTICNQIRALVA